jgi:hypothetical protein
MQSQNISDQVRSLNPPKKMIDILDIQDIKAQEREIAEWACDFGLGELRPKKLPDKPGKVREYYALTESDRKKMNEKPADYNRFWADDEVKKYFDEVQYVKNANKTNKEWLITIRSWLNPTAYAMFKKIDEILYEHGVGTKQASWNEEDD